MNGFITYWWIGPVTFALVCLAWLIAMTQARAEARRRAPAGPEWTLVGVAPDPANHPHRLTLRRHRSGQLWLGYVDATSGEPGRRQVPPTLLDPVEASAWTFFTPYGEYVSLARAT